MRTLSFILAFAFVLAGPSMAGSSENMMPGIGTFAYNGSPIMPPLPRLSSSQPAEALPSQTKKVAGKAIMLFRISSAAIVASALLAGSAQAQVAQAQARFKLQSPQSPVSQPQLQRVRSLLKMPDPRGEFVRLCAPHMVGRWAHPESVCGCLHDYAAATVEDTDLREALLRGISETGVPTIETDWVPPSKQSQIGATFTKIAKPTLQCMFEPAN